MNNNIFADTLLNVYLPWFVTILLIVTTVVFILSIPKLLTAFWKMPWKVKLMLILAIIAGALIRFYLVPNTHRIYFDEDRYLSPAVGFARLGSASQIYSATPEKILLYHSDNVARITVPIVNSWVLKLTGYSEENLFTTAKIFSVLAIVLIFIGAQLLFKNYYVSLFSTFGIALLPTPVYWSTSIGLDSYFLFFAILAFTASAWYGLQKNVLSFILLTSSLLLLLFVRLEAFLFLPVLITTIYSIRKFEKKKVIDKTELILGSFLLLLVILRGLVSTTVLTKTWCCGDATPLEAFGFDYVARNTIPNLFSLFNRIEFPFVLTILAIIGAFRKRDSRLLPIVIWAISYLFIYSFYFAGQFFTYQYSGSYGRYFLILIPPILMLSGITLSDIAGTKKWFGIASLLIVLAFCIPTARVYPYIIKKSPFDNLVESGPKEIHQFLEDGIIAKTEPNSIIIHALTAVTLLHNRTAIYFGTFLDDDSTIQFVKESIKNGTPVYTMETYTCQTYPEKCSKINPIFKFTKVSTETYNGHTYQMNKVELK